VNGTSICSFSSPPMPTACFRRSPFFLLPSFSPLYFECRQALLAEALIVPRFVFFLVLHVAFSFPPLRPCALPEHFAFIFPFVPSKVFSRPVESFFSRFWCKLKGRLRRFPHSVFSRPPLSLRFFLGSAFLAFPAFFFFSPAP